jgi:serine/threonine protein kinase
MQASSFLHPPEKALRAYANGGLDARTTDLISAHLDECQDCLIKVAGISSDGFLDAMRRAHSAIDSNVERPASANPHQQQNPEGETPRSAGVTLQAAARAEETLPTELANHPDYEILRELGRGGMGIVYLAYNRFMGRDEVLKVMDRTITDRPGGVERFMQEIRTVAGLRHPNIVTAYSASTWGGSVVFAMEYIAGQDLSRVVKTTGPVSVSHACYYAYQAALALQHAHEHKLVHRDIKPSNLMLTGNGDRPLIKVLDFGLAKVTIESSAFEFHQADLNKPGGVTASLTLTGQVLGTPEFIAPEQIIDSQSADIRADIYSLGCTLYYFLKGGPPFEAKTLYDMIHAHQSAQAEHLNLVRPQVPANLAALVAKMMAKEPARRFQTPIEVAQALEPFFRRRPASASRRNDPAKTSFWVSPMPSDMTPPELAALPHYQVLGELGRGRTGIVYLARNRLMGRDEALKVLAREITDHPEVLERFMVAIRSAAKLQHPNIAAAYCAFACGERVVLAMEYIEGHDLGQVVRDRGRLAIASACYYAHEAAQALGYAHEQGFVHRDIKPGNLMLSRIGDRPVIKVLNFALAPAKLESSLIDFRHEGTAREAGTAGSTPPLATALGTLDFLAPEQTAGSYKIDIRSDIYSLGCTLYYLLSGRPPFNATQASDLLQAHHSMDARLLNLVRPEVPVELAALVSKMMAKDPGQRFGTPNQAAKALVPFFSGKARSNPMPGPVADLVQMDLRTPAGVELSQSVTAASLDSPSDLPVSSNPTDRVDANPVGSLISSEHEGEIFAGSARPPNQARHFAPGALTGAGLVVALLGYYLLLPRLARDIPRRLPDPKVARASDSGEALPPVAVPDPRPSSPLVPPVEGRKKAGPGGNAPSLKPRTVASLRDLPDPPFADPEGNDRPIASPSKPPRRDPSRDLYWKESILISRIEDDVREAVGEFKKQRSEYCRAIIVHRSAHYGAAQANAVHADLLQQRDQLDQMREDLGAQDRRMYAGRAVMYRTSLEWEQTGLSGSQALRDLRLQIADLDQRRGVVLERIEQIKDRRKELTLEIELLKGSGSLHPQGLEDLEASLRPRREQYEKALKALRNRVDQAKLIYEDLRKDPRVDAEIVSKNQGQAPAKFKLGPHPQFLRIEPRLKQQEDWLRGTDPPQVRKGVTLKQQEDWLRGTDPPQVRKGVARPARYLPPDF